MWPFIEIKPGEITLDSGTCVLKKSEYQNGLKASELLHAAEGEAMKLIQGAGAAFEEQKILGWQAGVEEARVQQAAMVQKTLLQCSQYYNQVGHQLAQVVMQALRKIVHEYDDTELTLHTVRQELALINHQKQVMLYVQPQQVTAVRAEVARMMSGSLQRDYIDVIADAGLTRGGCRLETEFAVIDASIDSQLAALASALKMATGTNNGVSDLPAGYQSAARGDNDVVT